MTKKKKSVTRGNLGRGSTSNPTVIGANFDTSYFI
jgi:hypothetical protein